MLRVIAKARFLPLALALSAIMGAACVLLLTAQTDPPSLEGGIIDPWTLEQPLGVSDPAINPSSLLLCGLDLPSFCSVETEKSTAALHITNTGPGSRAIVGIVDPVNSYGYESFGGYFGSTAQKGRGVYAGAPGAQGIGVVGEGALYGGRFCGEDVGIVAFSCPFGECWKWGTSFQGTGVFGSGTNYGGVFGGDDADIVLTGTQCVLAADPSQQHGVLTLESNGNVYVLLDRNGDTPSNQFAVYHSGYASTNALLKVDESGKTTTGILELTGGLDVSESFPVSTQGGVRPGMVVSIDADHPGSLTISVDPYDRKVAGVVSGAGGIQVGMVMGQAGGVTDADAPIALTGRVYCLADASSSPIEPGDLLTTSGTPGHAMKVTDFDRAQGAILGKAMSSLDEGTGLVLVLINLQ